MIQVHDGHLHNGATANRVGSGQRTSTTLRPCYVHPDFCSECPSQHIHVAGAVEKVSTAQKNSQELCYSDAQPGPVWPRSRHSLDSV